MESYTFRCLNDDCGHYDQPITGITMQRVIDDGGPVCGSCDNDLELLGPDGTGVADAVRILKELTSDAFYKSPSEIREALAALTGTEDEERRNRPDAYDPVPGPPVNPSDVTPPKA